METRPDITPSMQELDILGHRLLLLPEKAIYLQSFNSLLVADVHLGKAETFQAAGIPIPHQINQATLARLRALCLQWSPERLFILGDLFHSSQALGDEVLESWLDFVQAIPAQIYLIIGNHDRHLLGALPESTLLCLSESVQLGQLLLSHEPDPQPNCLNICGHIHPCVRLQTRLDRLRLPCFYLDQTRQILMLPSFGDFTGGYEVTLKSGATAYVVVEDAVVSFVG